MVSNWTDTQTGVFSGMTTETEKPEQAEMPELFGGKDTKMANELQVSDGE